MRGIFFFLILSLVIGVGIGIAVSQGIPSPNNTPSDIQDLTSAPPSLTITEPLAGREIGNPLVIKGTNKEGLDLSLRLWDFEANLLGESQPHLSAAEGERQPFSFELNFSQPKSDAGYIELQITAPDGKDLRKEYIPVKFSPVTMREVFVFFPNAKKATDPKTCDEVLPLTRTVPADKAAENALRALLAQPTPLEKTQGYTTHIPDSAILNSLTIADGKAAVDFSDGLIQEVVDHCQEEGLLTQIEKTLTQFDEINTVAISVNGRTKDLFGP